MVQTVRKEEGEEMDEAGHSHDLGYGYTGFDEFRWDTMFQDLKPTWFFIFILFLFFLERKELLLGMTLLFKKPRRG